MSTSINIRHYLLNVPYIVHETIEGETIVMNLKNGFYYSFDGIGPAVWELIVKGASTEQITLLMNEIFPNCRLDLSSLAFEFIEELKTNEIIIEKQTVTSGNPELKIEMLMESSVFSDVTLKQPIFNRYTDMRDVLLLDPIHDVDVKGWPEPKQSQQHQKEL